MVKHLVAGLLALGLLFFGAQKFGADNIIFETIAMRSGLTIFEPTIRMFTGVAEIVTALLLVWPRMRGVGAVMALGVMSGAIGFHLSPWLGIHVPMAAGGEESIALFSVALVLWVLALINLALNWSRLPLIGR